MFKNSFNNKKVLITGNTGFKGSWLSAWLLGLGADVYGLSKDIPTSPSMYEVLCLEDKITHFTEDVTDLKAVKTIIDKVKPDFLFHMAAQPIVVTSYKEPVDTILSNVMGTTNVLEALRVLNNKCTAVIITSDKCYDNVEWVWGYKETDAVGGKDIYSGSKGAAEIIFKSYYHSYFKDSEKSKVRVVTVRAGNVIGGGDWADYRIVPDCMKAWVDGDSVEIRSPKATRPWQHVLEPLSGYLHIAMELDRNIEFNGESFNFGPDAEYSKSVKNLLDDLSKYWDLSQEPSYLSSVTSDFHEAGLLKLNCDKALFYIKWLPSLDYDKLIEFTSTWYYNYYNSNINMLDFTLAQIKEYEGIALSKDIVWTN
ncbi:CDP-glucose 4,6-dehydratase [Lutibacter sp. Hel_I_33_5]|uniref:CDP-glucose 4,6-dehydratase n=1 Tax=Lutibacter sp. Hel_I_33_5 TaxID=1566289 RepID=UPI0011A181FE|nr:CDP-glucose 4,6-dehydratase [Lutibacter sp. Hel_I_33_5]TVZ55492.1 CDP-glucose 4,6-dehydratase [Lutibacter sp. Hel_I_33_5]